MPKKPSLTPAALHIKRDDMSQKAHDLILQYCQEFEERTGGVISKSRAAVKLLEMYSDSHLPLK